MNLIRKLLKPSGGAAAKPSPDDARGSAPMQSEAEQAETRVRMEAEMAGQKERRESQKPGE